MVSVVIPAHNNASHLAAAVRSVLDQAERVGEIIDRFSMTRPDLPEKLRQYMMNAYAGYVL